jgi:hypothetical protein
LPAASRDADDPTLNQENPMQKQTLAARGTLAAVVATSTAFVATASAAPVASYYFQDTLAANEAGVPTLVAVDQTGANAFVTATVQTNFTVDPQPTTSQTVYRFDGAAGPNNNAGLILPDAGDLLTSSNTYTLELVYRFDSLEDFPKIVNFSELNNNSGIYADDLNGTRNIVNIYLEDDTGTFLNDASPDGPAAGEFASLVITSDGGLLDLYLNGALVSDDFNPQGFFQIDSGEDLTFFLDSFAQALFFSSGEVAKIALYDSTLSDTEISDLASAPFAAIPEPASAAVLVPSTLLLLRRRLRG